MNFKETLDLHLKSMQNKDFDIFISTICLEKITLIMPNGTLINNYDDFYKLHKDWFLDLDWSINYDLLNTVETSKISSALLSIDYKDCDEDGKTISMEYYLNLIFENINGKWLLIHDQNTIFKK